MGIILHQRVFLWENTICKLWCCKITRWCNFIVKWDDVFWIRKTIGNRLRTSFFYPKSGTHDFNVSYLLETSFLNNKEAQTWVDFQRKPSAVYLSYLMLEYCDITSGFEQTIWNCRWLMNVPLLHGTTGPISEAFASLKKLNQAKV